MAIEIKKGQNDWHKPINELSSEVDQNATVQTLNNPVSYINGVTGRSRISYVQLKGRKQVSLFLAGIVFPPDIVKGGAHNIGILPDGFFPEEEVQHSAKERVHLHVYTDGKVAIWPAGNADTNGMAFQCNYFTAD